MTRDDIKNILPEITDEQLKAIMDLNGKDTNKHKANIDELKNRLAEAQETIANLETAKGDTESLQAELNKYRQAEQDRIEAEKQKAIESELSNRFDACVGDAKFVNSLTRDGLFAKFKGLLADENNVGKGDKELFESLTKDTTDIFANTNTIQEMSGMGGTDEEQISGVEAIFRQKNPNIKF